MSSELVRASTDFSSWNPDAVFGGATYDGQDQRHQDDRLHWVPEHDLKEEDWSAAAGEFDAELEQEQQMQEFIGAHPSYSNPFEGQPAYGTNAQYGMDDQHFRQEVQHNFDTDELEQENLQPQHHASYAVESWNGGRDDRAITLSTSSHELHGSVAAQGSDRECMRRIDQQTVELNNTTSPVDADMYLSSRQGLVADKHDIEQFPAAHEQQVGNEQDKMLAHLHRKDNSPPAAEPTRPPAPAPQGRIRRPISQPPTKAPTIKSPIPPSSPSTPAPTHSPLPAQQAEQPPSLQVIPYVQPAPIQVAAQPLSAQANAALCIQKTVRGYLGRKRAVRVMLGKERQARKQKRLAQQKQRSARIIQRAVRAKLFRPRTEHQAKKLETSLHRNGIEEANALHHNDNDNDNDNDDEEDDDDVAVYTAALSPERNVLAVTISGDEDEGQESSDERSEFQVFSMSGARPLDRFATDRSLFMADDSLDNIAESLLQPKVPPPRELNEARKPVKRVRTGGISLIPTLAVPDSVGSAKRQLSSLRKRQSTPRFDARAIIEDQAATTIQRIWRGFLARRALPSRDACANCGYAEPNGLYCRMCGHLKRTQVAKPDATNVHMKAPENPTQPMAYSPGVVRPKNLHSRIPRLQRKGSVPEQIRQLPADDARQQLQSPPQHATPQLKCSPDTNDLISPSHSATTQRRKIQPVAVPHFKDQRIDPHQLNSPPTPRRQNISPHTSNVRAAAQPSQALSPNRKQTHRPSDRNDGARDGNGNGGGPEGYLAMFEKQRKGRRQKQPRRNLELAETESLPPIPSNAAASPTPSSYSEALRKHRTPSSAGNPGPRRADRQRNQRLPAI